MNEEIQRLAARLLQLHSPDEIRRFRAGLDKATAQAVIRCLDPVDRAAVLLCLQFEAPNRWAPFSSAIIADLDAAAIWAEGSEQVQERTLPSSQSVLPGHGQLPSRDKRRTATRRAR